MGDVIETYLAGADEAPFRAKAAEAFRATGFPARKLEAWRYTSLDKVKTAAYADADPVDATADFLKLDSVTALFVNGGAVDGFDGPVSSLAAGLAEGDVELTALLENLPGEGVFALNTARVTDGLVLHVAAGETLGKPVQLQHIAAGADKAASYLRNIVVLEDGAEATLIELYRGDARESWTNAVTDILLEAGATLHHVILVEGKPENTVTLLARARLSADAHYRPFVMQAGVGVSRAEIAVAIEGEGADVNLGALQLGAKGRSLDLYTHLRHEAGHATSNQVVRNIAGAEGVTSFQGLVHVARGADKTDAAQNCAALLLDATAEANAKPELKIYADDVKCAHGATVGALDRMQLFYLMSRGLTEAAARALLTEAFAEAPAEEIADEAIRTAVMERVTAQLAEIGA